MRYLVDLVRLAAIVFGSLCGMLESMSRLVILLIQESGPGRILPHRRVGLGKYPVPARVRQTVNGSRRKCVRSWVGFFNKIVDKLKGKGKDKDKGKSKSFRRSESPDDYRRRSPPRNTPERDDKDDPHASGPRASIPRTSAPHASGPRDFGPHDFGPGASSPRDSNPRPSETRDYDAPYSDYAPDQSYYTPAGDVHPHFSYHGYDWSQSIPRPMDPPQYSMPKYRADSPIYFAEPVSIVPPLTRGESSSSRAAQTEEAESQGRCLSGVKAPQAEQAPRRLSLMEAPQAEQAPRRSHRDRRPSSFRRSPWVNSRKPCPVSDYTIDKYEKWMNDCRGGKALQVFVKESGSMLEYEDFERVENSHKEFAAGVTNLLA